MEGRERKLRFKSIHRKKVRKEISFKTVLGGRRVVLKIKTRKEAPHKAKKKKTMTKFEKSKGK